MKASIIVSAAVIGSVSASIHNAHAPFHLRGMDDGVCTVYTTVYVYPSQMPTAVANSTIYVTPSPVGPTSDTCTEEKTPTPTPASSYVLYTPSPAPSSSWSSSSSTSSSKAAAASKEAYVPAPKYTPSPVVSVQEYAPSPAYSQAAPKSSKPAGYSGSSSGSGRIVTNGQKWAITYTPYTAEGSCKSASDVQGDIAKIAGMGFTTIRTYSTDCGVFENVVPAAQSHGLKIIYGIFMEGGGKSGKGPFSDYANEQLQEILSHAPKDSIAMLIVGNEALFNGYTTAEELGSYIDYVKEQFHSAGFPDDIWFTVAEPVNIWQEMGAELCSHVDVIGAQVHAFFTSLVYAPDAGDFVEEQLELAAAVCPKAAATGKFVTETGWPTSGETNGNAVPGDEQQKQAISSILEKAGKHSTLFSFQNDLWKAPGAYGVERSFGCAAAIS